MKYFITGVQGTGKTTIGKLLQEKGHAFVDVDYEPGLTSWYDKAGNKVQSNPDVDADWYSKHDWYWDRSSLEKLLENYSADKHIFVCGIAQNQLNDFDLFDRVFLLQVSKEELRKRRSGRKDVNDKPDDESDFVWHDSFERTNLDKGAVGIDAGQTTDEIIKEIFSCLDKE